MKRKISALLLSLVLLLSLSVPAFAAQVYVVDEAGLLTDQEEAALNEKALALREAYKMDIVIVTVESLNGQSTDDFADDYFDYNGYGYGSNYSGILFLLSMEERDWVVSTCGDSRYALTDYGIQGLVDNALPYLGEDQYYQGFSAYLDALDGYLAAYKNDTPIDGEADYSGNYDHARQDEVIYYQPTNTQLLGDLFRRSLTQGLIFGAVAALITVLVMAAQMNTKKPQRAASSYLDEQSYRVRREKDIFLYSSISKIRRQENSSSSGSISHSSRGGGSSVHTSSSGRSHGGGHGKF